MVSGPDCDKGVENIQNRCLEDINWHYWVENYYCFSGKLLLLSSSLY